MKNKVVFGIMVILFLTLALSIGINQCQSIVEMWVPYVPFSHMVDLDLWELSGIWHMDVSITFADSGYMISDWGTVMEDGYEFWVDCEIWDWTGYAFFVITTLSNTYSLGHLEEGSYTFTFEAWGIDVKSVSFTVPPDPASDPAPDLYVEATSLWWYDCPLIVIGRVYSVYVNVTNQGTADAGSFNVSFSTYWEYVPEMPESLEKKTMTSLGQGVTESMQFDFSVMNYGNYTIVVMADCDTAVTELDETNNVKTEWVIATVLGDIDGDGHSDPWDFARFRAAYGSRGPPQIPVPDPNYDPWADFDRDGDVDAFDFAILRVNYGQSAPLPPPDIE